MSPQPAEPGTAKAPRAPAAPPPGTQSRLTSDLFLTRKTLCRYRGVIMYSNTPPLATINCADRKPRRRGCRRTWTWNTMSNDSAGAAAGVAGIALSFFPILGACLTMASLSALGLYCANDSAGTNLLPTGNYCGVFFSAGGV